jgi:arabinogalactan oligomer / maltooligosaccharide transport system permease protein
MTAPFTPSSLSPSALFARLIPVAIADALALWAAISLFAGGSWPYLIMLLIATALLNVAVFSKRAIPLRYLLPGLVLMMVFQLFPVSKTITTSFTNFGSGNLISKEQAIATITSTSREITDESPRFTMDVLRNAAGEIKLILTNPDSGEQFIATKTAAEATFEPLVGSSEKVVKDEFDNLVSVGDFTRLKLKEIGAVQEQLDAFVVTSDVGTVRPTSADEAAVSVERYRYDTVKDQFVDVASNETFVAVRGTFTSTTDPEKYLEPGFKAGVGMRNFNRIFTDDDVRKPFLRIFTWNLLFAAGSVFATMAIGMFLAVVLNNPKMRGRSFYRQLLIIPYALPPFMMILVWGQGLMNAKYGYINKTFGWEVAWLQNPALAKFAIVLVNTWLGFPYMFLLCSGLLAAIPTDIYEAARVDGATGFQQFRKVTLPMLLVGLAPLLISSFAFNFNNFLPVYLMTGGGPPIPGGSTGGQTDILVTYTYKLAFGSGKGTQYGLAAAITIIIFFLVGAMSALSFRQTKAFKEL